jgi:ParB/RepB/Spo0J family partition protein
VSEAAKGPQYRVIPVALLDNPARPSRTTMDEEKLQELIGAIRRDGFTSVIGVFENGERFEVIYGHRRTEAARAVGIAAVPCFVYATKAGARMRLQYGENRFREELSVTDEAILFAELLEEDPKAGTDGLAAQLGEKRDYVEGRLALLRGCDRVFQALADKQINVGVAQQLNRCTEDAHRFMLLDMAVRGGATVGLVTQWISEWKTIHAPASGHLTPGAPIAASSGPSVNDYFRCRLCTENTDTPNMVPVQLHSYCLQTLVDPATGFFRSRADSVDFPRTREQAVALVRRVLERFPELADESAA